MLAVLSNQTYRRLFFAQVIALIGTGLATVALGLLAYDIAGGDAGAVLGTALAIKMIAYIGVAPIAGAFANRVPRRALLIAMDAARAGVAMCLPFVSEVWQVYVLIFVLQSASAAFTPTFQATIPDVLPDERDYTRALSLSRLAYDMESLTSPMLAAALLTVVNYHWLFSGTAVGFVASAMLVMATVLPRPAPQEAEGGIYDKTTRGTRIYLKTPRLRGLLALTLAAAAASAMVIVNTVVIVRGLGLGQRDVALTLAAFGGGSIVAALLLPRLLDRVSDRRVMLIASMVLTAALAGLALVSALIADTPSYWPAILVGWLVMGMAYSVSVTPSGRLLRRSANPDDRPALFAAQFALSHVCWLICYPLVGQLGARVGMPAAFGVMATLAAVGTVAALRLWPADDPDTITHEHPDLDPDDPHLRDHGEGTHPYVIDRRHRRWPDRKRCLVAAPREGYDTCRAAFASYLCATRPRSGGRHVGGVRLAQRELSRTRAHYDGRVAHAWRCPSRRSPGRRRRPGRYGPCRGACDRPRGRSAGKRCGVGTGFGGGFHVRPRHGRSIERTNTRVTIAPSAHLNRVT